MTIDRQAYNQFRTQLQLRVSVHGGRVVRDLIVRRTIERES